MFGEAIIKCDICGKQNGLANGFNNDKEECFTCKDCQKAVKYAIEHARYLQNLYFHKKK